MKTTHLLTNCCLAVALLFSATLQAEAIQKKSVAIEDIDQVEVAGPGLLTITQGDSESLEIIASEKIMDRIEVDAHGSTLRLRLKEGSQWGFFRIDDGIQYKLTVKQLNKIKSMGSVDVELASDLNADHLKLDSAGSGDMRFKDITVRELDMSSAGSGDFTAGTVQAHAVELSSAGSGDLNIGALKVATTIEISSAGSGDARIDSLNAERLELSMAGSGDTAIGNGEVTSQSVDIGGSGDYSASGLKSKMAEMDLSGSADATVWVTEELRVDASGASDVQYFGQPLVKVDTSGASSVKSLGASPK
ncbi:head GIN domain-containing protein [Simiduia aestuariiviva]|uniref:Putative auto-transporter adhesin head GIN domain-containing protein n=1 Tax=Simiduia aestuariiviva TaxID=1510459 RepID=A0A839UR18_9GAMM|nr:head GIN domain-containing protein [Simiduia aestuariiviva]MBB3168919.1 hypothetical protein [Simiduia aestuariiviva]